MQERYLRAQDGGRAVEEASEPDAFPAAVALALVRQLAPSHRLVILGLYWGELSVSDLGRLMKKNRRDVQLLLTGAREAMKQALHRNAPPPGAGG
jgi:DNA-directed RNA polymerase specialized sigma24 family protein